MTGEPKTRGWVEVDADAMRANLRTIRETAGPAAGLLPMVKADAYGLGMARAMEAMAPEDPWGWGVATVEEGEEARSLDPARPILVLSPIPGALVPDALEARLTLAVSDVSLLERIAREAARRGGEVAVHVEVDTGMGRAGFDWREVEGWGRAVAALTGGNVRWEGCFTHFHSAEEVEGPSLDLQVRRFEEALRVLREEVGVDTETMLLHLCNSSAVLRRPELSRSLVRSGLFLYGGSAGAGLPEPVSVASVRARVVLVREVSLGTTVGYGATYAAQRPERWATVGLGYGDGLRRSLSNRGDAIVGGRRVPIIGRISMDMVVVDITGIEDVEVGAPVTFLGTDGKERITLEEMAEAVGTNAYEILTGFTPRLPRLWFEGGAAGRGGHG
ncbi:MAG: alanine racemase [Gemmatimonadota bacterium]